MDSKEADAYLETAEDQLKEAESALRRGSSALCVFMSASSAENASSALLISLGAKPSRKHRNSLVLHRLAQHSTPETRSNFEEMIKYMKALEPHITKARYPTLKGLELLPPSKLYTIRIAQEALDRARKVIGKVKSLLGNTRSNWRNAPTRT